MTTEQPGGDGGRWRERFPKAFLGVGATWSAWWLGVTVAGPTDPIDLPTRVGISLFFFALAAAPWGVLRDSWRSLRGDRPSRSERREARRVESLARLPEDARVAWGNLEQAQQLLFDLAARGWVDDDAAFELVEETERLRELLEMDEQTDRIGGAPSTGLRDRVVQLRDLVVALCDEAVEHQSETQGKPVPATLRDAHDRLRAERLAKRTVDEIGGTT